MALSLAPQVIERSDYPASMLEDLKRHVVADFDYDDEVLTMYLKAAISRLDGTDGILGRALLEQTVIQQFGCLDGMMFLPYGKASEIVSVSYFDTQNEAQTLEGELIEKAGGSFVYLANGSQTGTYNRPNAVTVTYKAGWGTPDDVPDAIKQAIRLMAAHWYQFREEALISRGGNLENIPLGVSDLIAPYRRVGV